MGEDMLSARLDDDCEPDYCDPAQRLGLIERLESYADAELVYTRQLTARGVVRALQFVEEYNEAQRLLAIISKISDDPDVTVRADLLENIPAISHFCHDNSSLFANAAESPLSDFILPFVLKYVRDSHNQIRKASQASILYLLEHRILSPEDSAAKLVPVVINFAQCQSSDDIRADAANLMCKMAPVLGSELTKQLLLEPFLRLCTDAVFHVRKVCAMNIGDFCYVLGQQRTEESVLAKFYALCEDSIWGVRKACCECFAQVSSMCTPAVRRTELSQLFINLIYDQSRWVRMAAFETLGSFIATFADSTVTGLYLTDDGVLDFRPVNGQNINLTIYDIQKMPAENGWVDDEQNCSDVPNANNSFLKDKPSSNHSESCDGLIESNSETEIASVLIKDESSEKLERNKVLAKEDELKAEESFEDGQNPLDPTSSSCSNSPYDGEYNDDAKESQSESVVVPNGKFVIDGGIHSTPCTEDGNFDDESKPSLEMFTSEVDNVDISSAVHCGSLELLCENDDEADLRSEKTLQVSVGADESALETIPVCHVNDVIIAVDIPETSTVSHLNVDVDVAMNHTEESTISYAADVDVAMKLPGASPIINVDVAINIPEKTTECPSTDVDVAMNLVNTSTTPLESDVHVDICESIETTTSTPVIESLGEHDHKEHVEIALESEMVSEKSVDTLLKVSAGLEVMRVCDDDIGPEELEKVKGHLNNIAELLVDKNAAISNLISENPLNEEIGSVLVSVESDVDDSSRLDSAKATESLESSATDDGDNNVIDIELGMLSTHKNSSSENDDAPFNLVETANPSMLNVEDSFDQFLNDEDRHGKGVSLTCLENLDESTESGEDSTDEDDQSVVPRDLLNQYLGMMDPSCALTVDNEVTRHCAYSLPAVAFTLGRRNWPALRNLYRALCSDVQWKVRRTLASSMHELAMIVGEEVTVRDLVPVFDQFLGDLDEVRIGVLKHLADFIKMLPDDVRYSYLAKLAELLRVDNSHNWRFREEIANQLCFVVDLYNPSEVRTYICPMAFALADDKVAAVRLAAVNLLCSILKRLMDTELRKAYVNELTSQFASSNHYIGRQMFIQLCDCALENDAVESQGFSDIFLQPLLSLHIDRVPNVRIALARTIARHADRLERLCRECAINPDLLDGVVNLLKHDVDRDVRMLIDRAKLFTVLC